MASAHLAIGAVLFANEDTILLTDRTLFIAPIGMHLPPFPTGVTVVIEYEIVEGRNVLTRVPKSASNACCCVPRADGLRSPPMSVRDPHQRPRTHAGTRIAPAPAQK